MKKIKNYITGSIEEVRHRVTWPGFSQLQRSAVLVLVASLIFAILIGVIDVAFKNALEFFYNEF